MNANPIFPNPFEADRMQGPRATRSEASECEARRKRTAEQIILDASERIDAPSRGEFVFQVVVTLGLVALSAWFALG